MKQCGGKFGVNVDEFEVATHTHIYLYLDIS